MESNKLYFAGAAGLAFLFMQVIYPMPGPLIYVFLSLSACLVLPAMSNGWAVNGGCIALLLVAAISIATNEIPVFFKPWPRYALFSLLMVGCSPMFHSNSINRLRRHIWMGVLWALGGIAVWSFVAYFTGQGLYIWGIVNGYMGVTGHPNFLGFYVMVVMIWGAALFFRCTVMVERVITGGLWMACLIVLLLTASRISLACGLMGSLAAVYLRLQDKVSGLLTAAMVLVGVAFFAWPVLAPYTATMQKKEINFDDTDSMIAASRGSIWKLRYAEIAESPWIGVGAYSCDVHLPNADVFYSETNGSIELGSSYLGLLSQCGWLGFLSFMAILIPIAWKSYRYATREKTPYAQFMFPLIIAVCAHMVFEGYAMTAGAMQCVVLWLILGCADQCDVVADYPVLWEKQDPPTPAEYVAWKVARSQQEYL